MKPVRRIYADYAAATPLDPKVKTAMEPYWSERYGNAGAPHEEGRRAKEALESARNTIASHLGVHPDEITFTSGGTEANNLSTVGLVRAMRARGIRGEHGITSAIEHPSVLDVFRHLEASENMSMTYLSVDASGCVDPRALQDALTPETILVSIVYVNSEIGTVQPIRDIAKVIRKHRKEQGVETPYLHIDASQAPLFADCRPIKLGVDLMTLDAQKLYGPKGVGLLYHRRGVPLTSLFYGGGQERGLRPGTENIPLIVGFAEALAIAVAEHEASAKNVGALRDHLIEDLLSLVPDAHINGSREVRVANNVSVTVPGVDSEYVVALLDVRGVAAATKSACLSGDERGSYVLRELGEGSEHSGAVRFSLGKETTMKDVRYIAEAFADSVTIARKSPQVSDGTNIDES